MKKLISIMLLSVLILAASTVYADELSETGILFKINR